MTFKKILSDFMKSDDTQLIFDCDHAPWKADGIRFQSWDDTDERYDGIDVPFELIKRRVGKNTYMLYAVDTGFGDSAFEDSEDEQAVSCENGHISPNGTHDMMRLLVYSPGRPEIFPCWTDEGPNGNLEIVNDYIYEKFPKHNMLSDDRAQESAKRLNEKYVEMLHARYSDEELITLGNFSLEECIQEFCEESAITVDVKGKVAVSLGDLPELLNREAEALETHLTFCNICDVAFAEIDRFFDFDTEDEYIEDVIRRLLAEIPSKSQFHPRKDPAAKQYTKFITLNKYLAKAHPVKKMRNISKILKDVPDEMVKVEVEGNNGKKKHLLVETKELTSKCFDMKPVIEKDSKGKNIISDGIWSACTSSREPSFVISGIKRICSCDNNTVFYEAAD